jgi:hypothetical protein
MKSVEYLTAKVEALEKELGLVRQDFGNEIKDLKKQTLANTRWILIATGATSTVVFFSHAIDWYMKYLETKGHP